MHDILLMTGAERFMASKLVKNEYIQTSLYHGETTQSDGEALKREKKKVEDTMKQGLVYSIRVQHATVAKDDDVQIKKNRKVYSNLLSKSSMYELQVSIILLMRHGDSDKNK